MYESIKMLEMLRLEMELMPQGVKGVECRNMPLPVSSLSHHTEILIDYLISKNTFISLVGLKNEFECLRCSPVIHEVLHDAFDKLRSEYGLGPG